MNQFTDEELKNILVLISRAHITGQEATATAILQQKIQALISQETSKTAPEAIETENMDKDTSKGKK